MEEEEERYAALIEFLGCFPSITGKPPTVMEELGDGVALFEALSEISQDHFDTSTIARDLGDNWALKSNNLRKLLRNLEAYYHDILHKDADFEGMASSISSIARNSDSDAIASLIELIAAAAVTCDNRVKFVGWIMTMSDANQSHMKVVIESSLSRMEEYDVEGDELSKYDNHDSNIGERDEFLSDTEDDFEGGAEMTGLFRNAMKNIDAVTHSMDVGTLESGLSSSVSIAKDRDELRTAVTEARRELATYKTQSKLMAEGTESSQKKLRALAQDLQERLETRQNELNAVEEELVKTKRILSDTEERVLDLAEKNGTLADELDVANAKAIQLRKSEATVVAYRKRLEGVGVMNQQMTDLEDQAAGYLRQIMDLEMETKKVPELQKNLEMMKRDLLKMEKEMLEMQSTCKSKAVEVTKLKAELSESVVAKKMFEDELIELRASVQDPNANDADIAVSGASTLSLTSARSVCDLKEKVMRLEIENNSLKEKVSTAGSSSESIGEKIPQLKDELEKKEAKLKKLATDKDKLEAYTKKTLAKFQEKYLVALQECKAKLKEKHDKIETLEKRSAAEKSTQKREEKLLSATIYELGLSIMQRNLKER